MANGRNIGRKGDAGRDAGGFVALPWTVLDCPAYGDLSHPARSLLMEMARQYVRDNNGRLLASRAYLFRRGWKSADVIDRAKHELLAAGFIFETVKGQRPNKASWYAVTWRALDKLPGYDVGVVQCFERGAYQKNATLSPSRGTGRPLIAPSPGTEKPPPVPSHGTIRPVLPAFSVPPDGHHLEKPSIATRHTAPREGSKPAGPAKQNDPVLGMPSLVDAALIETTRVCDQDLDPALYDETNGEHYQRPPVPVPRQRQAADAWVNTVFNNRRAG